MIKKEPKVFISADQVMRMDISNIQYIFENNKFPVMAVMQRLQQLGYNWNFMNKSYKNLLHFAAEEGDCAAIKLLIDSNIYDINFYKLTLFQYSHIPCSSALNYAARNGHFEAVKLLISRGANYEVGTEISTPVIIDSIQSEGSEIFDYLLELGAPINKTDRYGRTCLDQAAAKGNVLVLDKLLSMGCDHLTKSKLFQATLLHEACKYGKSAEMIKKLLDLGFNPYEPCATGERPIDFLIMYGNYETLSLMLNSGVDFKIIGSLGEPALYYACIEVNMETALLLIEKGANVNAISKSTKYYPITVAVELGDLAMIEVLLLNGADKSVCTSDGNSLLALSMKLNNFAVFEFLLRAGCSPNEISPNNMIPLH